MVESMSEQSLTLIGDTVYLFGYPVLKLLDGPPSTIVEKVRHLIESTNEDDGDSEYQRGYNDGVDDGSRSGSDGCFTDGYDEGYEDAKHGRAKQH